MAEKHSEVQTFYILVGGYVKELRNNEWRRGQPGSRPWGYSQMVTLEEQPSHCPGLTLASNLACIRQARPRSEHGLEVKDK